MSSEADRRGEEPVKTRNKSSVPEHAKPLRSRTALSARTHLCQKERTQATRRKLLDAAKRIFAQDGFEAARLEDIAARAGYTRGAFYANFDSKEDIFFALFEEWVCERIDAVTIAMRSHSDPAGKLAALRKHYAELATDRSLVLISMEFKLFALRHPEAHARLRSRHRQIRAYFGELFSELMHELDTAILIGYPAASACLGAVAQGLLLEHLIDPKTLSEADIRHALGQFFDSIFEAA
jgi:AcrR family transcriptional regulator